LWYYSLKVKKMLVNLTPNWDSINRGVELAKEHNFEYYPWLDEKSMPYGVGIYIQNAPFYFDENNFIFSCK
jgi:hypothetical protein